MVFIYHASHATVRQQPTQRGMCFVRDSARVLFGNRSRAMEDGRRDRRVLRSRRLLQEALVALILERGYEAVTVQDVLDRADVGRATFYAHFANREALLLSVFADLRDALRAEIIAMSPAKAARIGEGLGLVQPLFAHAERHRRLYRVLLRSSAGAILLRYLQSALALPLREHLEAACAERGLTATDSIAPAVAGFVSATLGVLVWWIEEDAPHSPAEMDLLVERLLGPGIEAVLTRGVGWEGTAAMAVSSPDPR